MATNIYAGFGTEVRERKALEPGVYGTNTTPGLKLIQYIDSPKASKEDVDGVFGYSFLVAAEMPNREQLAHAKEQTGGTFLGSDYEGTAFYKLKLHKMWLNPETAALAFTVASTNKEGKTTQDHVAAT